MSKSKSKRCYWISLICYSAPNTFKPLLDISTHWAYAYHDLDVDKEGKLKEPHYHILVHFKQARSPNSCIRYILSKQNVFGEECVSPLGAFEYLFHKNDPDKYQYDKSIVITHNPVYWDRFLPDIRDRTNIDFVEDLFTGVDMLTMAKRYGRDYMKNYRAYEDFIDEVKFRQSRNVQKSISSSRLPWAYISDVPICKSQSFTDDDLK